MKNKFVSLIIKYKTIIFQLIKYNIIGTFSIFIDIGVFALLNSYGIYYVKAQIISYICGITNSYVFNKRWTFDRHEINAYETIKFIILNSASLGISLLIIYSFETLFGGYILVGKVIATIFCGILNFIGNKLWVFRTLS